MTKGIPKAHSSIVLHHSSCRGAPVLISANPVEGSRYHQSRMHTSYRLRMSYPFLAPALQLEFPFQHAESSCMLPTTPPKCRKKGAVSHDPTLVTSQVRVQELRQLSQHARTNCPVLDSQEAHKSSWEGTVRRGTGMQTKRTRSFKLPCSSNCCKIASVYLCSVLELRRNSMMISEAIW